MLDEILGVGKISRDMIGVCYNEMNEEENKFVPPERKNDFQMSYNMSKQPAHIYYHHIIPLRKLFYRCHYFENFAHIQPK